MKDFTVMVGRYEIIVKAGRVQCIDRGDGEKSDYTDVVLRLASEIVRLRDSLNDIESVAIIGCMVPQDEHLDLLEQVGGIAVNTLEYKDA